MGRKPLVGHPLPEAQPRQALVDPCSHLDGRSDNIFRMGGGKPIGIKSHQIEGGHLLTARTAMH